MIVYVLFEYDCSDHFKGVFSSEKEAVKGLLSIDPMYEYYDVRACDVDTNKRRKVSKSLEDFLRWLEVDAVDELNWEVDESERKQQLCQLAHEKFPKLFD